jgi:ribosomal protein S6--L-glutamate ligase
MTSFAFVLGVEPSPASLVPEVLARLERFGATTSMQVVGEAVDIEPLARADVVVPRALALDQLAWLRPLEDRGVRCCNRVAASHAARDKGVTARLLAEAGVPMPATRVIMDWAGVEATAARGPVVVKPVQGSRGKGVVFLPPTPEEPSWPGPYLVQDRIEHDGQDRKVYVAGERVGGVLRRWPPSSLLEKRGQPFEPNDEERRVAFAAGAALGLEIYGVDLVVGVDGPLVVDVNGFPGFKGVPSAAAWVAEHLATVAGEVKVLR